MIKEGGAVGSDGTEISAAWSALCARWALSDAERRGLLPGSGVEGEREGAGMRMRVLAEIAGRLKFDDDGELRDWLRGPDLLFRLDSPLDVMSGSLGDLLRFRTLVWRGLGS